MVTPITVQPKHIYFGFDGPERQSFVFNEPLEGDRVEIAATLHKVADGNSGTDTAVKKILVKFADVPPPFVMTPSPVVFQKGVPQTIAVTVTPRKTGATMTNLNVKGEVGQTNNIFASVSGNTITFTGTPTVDGVVHFVVSAIIDGVLPETTMYFPVTTGSGTPVEKGLTASPASLSGKTDQMLSQTVTVTTSPAGSALGALSVSPTSWNDVKVTVDGNKVLFSGTPTKAGTQAFTISGSVDGQAATATVTLTVTSDTPVPPVSEVFSPNADNWDATYNTGTRAFTMSTPIEGLTAADIDSIVASFANSGAVTGVEAKTVDGALVIRGTIVSGFTPADVVISRLLTTLKDGTTCDQSGLSIGLSEILAHNRDDHSSSNCSTGFAGLALLMAVPLFFRKRG